MHVAFVHYGKGEVNEANAAHIVRCVNTHDALLGALKGLLEAYIEENGGDMPSNDEHPAFVARAAIQSTKQP